MAPMTPPMTGRREPRKSARVGGRLVATAILAVAATGLVTLSAPVGSVAAVQDDDWIGVVNAYRSMSGLGLVTENPTWSAEGRDHSCYMLLNGISHHEVPGNPGYTPGGHTAGMNGNVAVSSSVTATPRSHIELWMTGPFHAIGVLRHNLNSSGFGLCASSETSPWRSGATLDVLRGLGDAPRPSIPTVFPGRDSTVPLHRFIAETPNPVTLCGWSGDAGLPLIAMMPSGVSAANSSLTGPNGPVETCTLHPGNTGADATARAVLQSENAVVVVPRQHLATGRYTATVDTDGGSVTWSFDVDPNAPLPNASAPPLGTAQPTAVEPRPTTSTVGPESVFQPITPYRHADSRRSLRVLRLRAGTITPVEMAPPDVTAVSANFTVAGQAGAGYLSAFNCSPVAPDVSTVNFGSLPAANQAVIPLSSGSLCLFSSVDTHVIIDLNGTFRAEGAGTTTFHPLSPSRIYDTRGAAVARLQPGEIRRVKVRGVAGGAPADASAVAVNLTAVLPSAGGWLRAFPCRAGASSDVSNVNFGPGETRPNSAVVPVSNSGEICLQSDVSLDVIVDLGGYFTADGGRRFTALRPLRIVDTRSNSTALNLLTAGTRMAPRQEGSLELAGVYGIPADTRAVSVNVTVVDPAAAGYLSVYPCGSQPSSSNLNFRAEDGAVANGAMVGLGSDGRLCFSADQAVHVLLDVTGVWR